MNAHRLALFAVLTVSVMLLFGLLEVSTESNTVPASRAGVATLALDANALRPNECITMNLTKVVKGSGRITGTSANDLILGSSGNDTIDGGGGDDCIIGGAGNDDITGGNGNDVCIGGPGNDTFHSCKVQVQ